MEKKILSIDKILDIDNNGYIYFREGDHIIRKDIYTKSEEIIY